MRVAIYYLPEPHDPLWDAGCRWLGWDSVTGQARPQPPGAPTDLLTQRARRYGFHATIKAPMPLRGSVADFIAAAAALIAGLPSFTLSPLHLVCAEGFLSLRLQSPCPALHAVADTLVRELDPWRQPYGDTERKQRDHAHYSPRQSQHLRDWGYPHVFADFVFHMTLSDALAEPDDLLQAARAHFTPPMLTARPVEHLAVLLEEAPEAPFHVIYRASLGQGSALP
jgi:hypothetical protein